VRTAASTIAWRRVSKPAYDRVARSSKFPEPPPMAVPSKLAKGGSTSWTM
jgi:hypothetical protein